ncbi:MAG: putative DNA-binding domain-containing protein [Pseudomonadota bacterium]
MKTPLPPLQAAFHDHLLDLPSDIAREVAQGGRIGVEHRLRIYYNAYRVRLLEALQDAFEKTWTYLGDDAFESAALAFIEENPPQSRNLRWYGAAFPAWLAGRFPDDLDVDELAEVDWQLRRAFDGLDAAPLQPGELASLPPEQWATAGFRFAPTLYLTPLRYNTAAIWHALDQGQTPPATQALPDAAWLLIWRKQWQPHFRSIEACEQAALSRLLAGASFAEVCADLGRQFPDQEAASIAARFLRTWIDDEMIVGLASSGTPSA